MSEHTAATTAGTEEQGAQEQPTRESPSGTAPGGLAVALLVVALFSVGALAYVTWLYLQIQERLAETMTELEEAEQHVNMLLTQVAERETRALQEEVEAFADDDDAGEAAYSTHERFVEVWEQVRDEGMRQYEFLLFLDDSALWPLYRELVTQDYHSLEPETRTWLALICARLGMHKRAREKLYAVVEAKPDAWPAWLELVEIGAVLDESDEALQRALDFAVEQAPDGAALEQITELRERLDEAGHEEDDEETE